MNKGAITLPRLMIRLSSLAISFAMWLAVIPEGAASAAVLTHRFPFGATADDVVGGAIGVLQGNAALMNGAVVLDGTNSGVQVSNDLFTNYTAVTFEVWFVDEVATNANSVLYQFTSTSGTNGGITLTGLGRGSYLSNNISQVLGIRDPIPGLTNHLIWTQDRTTKTAALYLDGILAGKNTNFTFSPVSVGTITNSWIGAAGAGSAVFKGSILEFRVYQGALTALEAAQSDAAGPDQPQAVPGALQSVRVVAPSTAGPGALLSPEAFADYANLTNVNIISQPELVLSSDNTNVIAVTVVSNLWFPFQFSKPFDSLSQYTNINLLTISRKLKTKATGTATVKISYLGFSNSTTVAVSAPQDFALIHRYSFGEPAGTYLVHDSVGDAHGRVMASPSSAAAFSGIGELALGNTGPAYVKLPPGIISCQSEVTVEAWATYQGPILPGNWTAWARIFDFGDQTAGVGKTYWFLTPRNDSDYARTAASSNGIPGELTIIDWANGYPLNVSAHVAITYSPVRNVAKFYYNGKPSSPQSATTPLAAINDMNNWLGRSQFVEDPYLRGRYNEFRIYSGFLSDADIAADYAAGPDVIGSDFLLHIFPSNTNLTLTWGSSVTNWILESSSVLGAGAGWTQVPQSPTNQSGRFTVTVPMSDDARFFRLHNPN